MRAFCSNCALQVLWAMSGSVVCFLSVAFFFFGGAYLLLLREKKVMFPGWEVRETIKYSFVTGSRLVVMLEGQL